MKYLQYGNTGINPEGCKDLTKTEFKKLFEKKLGPRLDEAWKDIQKALKRTKQVNG